MSLFTLSRPGSGRSHSGFNYVVSVRGSYHAGLSPGFFVSRAGFAFNVAAFYFRCHPERRLLREGSLIAGASCQAGLFVSPPNLFCSHSESTRHEESLLSVAFGAVIPSVARNLLFAFLYLAPQALAQPGRI
jgi:hypothetical protein